MAAETEGELCKFKKMKKVVRTFPTLLQANTTAAAAVTTKPLANCFTEEDDGDDDPSSQDQHRRRSFSVHRGHWREAWSLSTLLSLIPKSPSPICSSSSGNGRNGTTTRRRSRGGCGSPSPQHTDLLFPDSPSSSTFFLSPFHKSEGADFASSENNHDEEEAARGGGKKEECHSRNSGSIITSGYESAKDSREMALEAGRGEVGDCDEVDDSSRMMMMMMGRPKPYHEFLDEVKRHKIDAQIHAWKKAKEYDLQNRLWRKEADIEEWELRQIHKAKEEMRNYEKLLEEKRARASQRMQEKISCAKVEAENQRTRVRRSMLAELSKVKKISEKTWRVHLTRSKTWSKLVSLH